MTKIGFLVGKDEEIYEDKELRKQTPKKFLVGGQLNTDVAIAMLIKLNYTHVTVDIILPKPNLNPKLISLKTQSQEPIHPIPKPDQPKPKI